MRNLERGQQIKQNKQMPKWQLFNQIAKILPLQTTQFQIVACHFFAKKHSTVLLKGLIYICSEEPFEVIKDDLVSKILYHQLQQSQRWHSVVIMEEYEDLF